jgi:hypothetical protein
MKCEVTSRKARISSTGLLYLPLSRDVRCRKRTGSQYLSVVVTPNTAASLIRDKPVGSFGFGMPPEGRKTY